MTDKLPSGTLAYADTLRASSLARGALTVLALMMLLMGTVSATRGYINIENVAGQDIEVTVEYGSGKVDDFTGASMTGTLGTLTITARGGTHEYEVDLTDTAGGQPPASWAFRARTPDAEGWTPVLVPDGGSPRVRFTTASPDCDNLDVEIPFDHPWALCGGAFAGFYATPGMEGMMDGTIQDEGDYCNEVFGEDCDRDDIGTGTTGGSTGTAGNSPPQPSFMIFLVEGGTPRPINEGNEYFLEGDVVQLDMTDSFDPDGDDLEYFWDFDGDGMWDVVTSQPVLYLNTQTSASGQVKVQVRDTNGGRTEATRNIVVANLAPVASVQGPTTAFEGEDVLFNGAGTTDTPNDLGTLNFNWVFSDGGIDWIRSPTHVFTTSGPHWGDLTVVDNDGEGSTPVKHFVSITNVKPKADAGENAEILQGETWVLNGSGTTDSNNDLPTLTYEWYTGGQLLGTGRVLDHTFDLPGTFEIRLDVTDDDGEKASDVVYIVVAPVTTPFHIGSDITLDKGNEFTFAPTFSSSQLGEVTYRWDFGDGRYSTDPTPEHAFEDSGVFMVSLSLTDTASGVITTSYRNVTVLNTAPEAVITIDGKLDEDELIRFDASSSVDTPGDVLSYAWYLDDRLQTSDPWFEKSFSESGQHTLNLLVEDDEDAIGETWFNFTIQNVYPGVKINGLTDGVSGDTILFTSKVNDTPSDKANIDFTWSIAILGLGGSASTFEATFDEGGIFNVDLKIKDDNGATAMATHVVTVEEPLVPDASFFTVISSPTAENGGIFLYIAIIAFGATGAWWFTSGKAKTGQGGMFGMSGGGGGMNPYGQSMGATAVPQAQTVTQMQPAFQQQTQPAYQQQQVAYQQPQQQYQQYAQQPVQSVQPQAQYGFDTQTGQPLGPPQTQPAQATYGFDTQTGPPLGQTQGQQSQGQYGFDTQTGQPLVSPQNPTGIPQEDNTSDPGGLFTTQNQFDDGGHADQGQPPTDIPRMGEGSTSGETPSLEDLKKSILDNSDEWGE